MQETLASIRTLRLDEKAHIGILDLGLTPAQREALPAQYTIRRAEWHDPVLDVPFKPYELGLVARTELRDYFPGYDIYLWFDADAWAQTDEFFELMVEGARHHGAAVVRENGHGQRRDYLYSRWWYGHMIASFGVVDGFRVARKPAVNCGILALSDTAPHWSIWSELYRRMIERRRKMNMDQHAFNAALELTRLPRAELPARCNWVSVLSTPMWDARQLLVCEPAGSRRPLSIIHLAGPNKNRIYKLNQTTGGEMSMALTYAAVRQQMKVDAGPSARAMN